MIEQAYVSIREMCGMVSIPQDSLFMFLKAYFDGSGSFSPKAQDGILTLGGYAGRAEAWDRFEAAWTDILHKYGISHFSATDADATQREFSGWHLHKVALLRSELLNIRRDFFKPSDEPIVSISCSIDISDYRRAEKQREDLPKPTALCGERCVRSCLSLVDGHLHLCFDRGEKFHVHLYRLWQSKKGRRRYPWLKLIREFAVAQDSKLYPGLQAADHLVCTTYRQLTVGDQAFQWAMLEARGQHAHELFEFKEILNYESYMES